VVYNYSFHTCFLGWGSFRKEKKKNKCNDSNQDLSSSLYEIQNYKKVENLNLVVGSPSFWNAPNSTWTSKSGLIPAKTSLNKVLEPCQICPKKSSRPNESCPKVNQPLGLLRKTPSDFKVAWSNSKISPNWARLV